MKSGLETCGLGLGHSKTQVFGEELKKGKREGISRTQTCHRFKLKKHKLISEKIKKKNKIQI